MTQNDGTGRLAIQVFKQAIKDAVTDTSKITNSKRKLEAQRDKEEAVQFLTRYTEAFEFWCHCANLNPELVFKETCKVRDNTPYWNILIRRLDKIDKSMLILQNRIKLLQTELVKIEYKRFKTDPDIQRIHKLKNELETLKGQQRLFYNG